MKKLKFLLNKQLELKAVTILQGKLPENYLQETNAYELGITEWWEKCENGYVMAKLLLSKNNKKTYLVCAEIARTVLHIFEDEFPNDNRLRLALEAAEKFARDEITEEELQVAADAAANVAAGAVYFAANAVYATASLSPYDVSRVVYWTAIAASSEQESYKNSANIIRKHFPNVQEVL